MESITILDTNDITDNEIRLLTCALVRNMSRKVFAGYAATRYDYKGDGFIANYHPTNWLSRQHILLVLFLKSICVDNNDSDIYFAKIIEIMYNIYATAAVMPLSFCT